MKRLSSSKVEGSIHCKSSTTNSTGCCCASLNSQAREVSRIFCLCRCDVRVGKEKWEAESGRESKEAKSGTVSGREKSARSKAASNLHNCSWGESSLWKLSSR